MWPACILSELMLLSKLIVNGIFYVKLVCFFKWFLDAFRIVSIKYLFCQLQKMSIFYSKLGREIKEKTILKRSKYHEFGSKFGQKSSRGPSGRPLAPLGVPKGSQTEFWEWKAGSLDPPWTPRWGPFFDFFSMQNSSIFLLDLNCLRQ